jgi:hypothetical protein
MQMLDPFETCISMKVNMLALESMFTIKQMKNLDYNDVDNVHSKETGIKGGHNGNGNDRREGGAVVL